MIETHPLHNTQKINYGIYTVGDENFFPGIVASINSLKYYGYNGPIAVLDIGFSDWMQAYLSRFDSVSVLSINPVKKDIRFVDILSNESPVMQNWAYKAFGILFYDLFENWTFIDGDYFPLCNLEKELKTKIEQGQFLSTEDGINKWGISHREAVGVNPGTYMNINCGFISLSMKHYGYVIHEWRNLMTRYKPSKLWYGDQGALNAILDKYKVEKTCLNKILWNQTWLNEKMTKENKCIISNEGGKIHINYQPLNSNIMAWHGTGWHKLWHQIGIDHYRKEDAKGRVKFLHESQGKSPEAILEIFKHFLFLDDYNKKLKQDGHLLTI